MLLPTDYLSVARAHAGAVFIPLEELPHRTHELPPPHCAIRLIRDSLDAYAALGWLQARGRQAQLAEPPPNADGNARYRLWRPNEWLESVAPRLHPDSERRALDLGCGGGREAVYLADLGWRVCAVDRLPEAMERGRDLQTRYAPDSAPIMWLCADLEKSQWQPSERYELITLFYFYSRGLIARACEWLVSGGALLVEAFTVEHRAQCGKPASDLRVVRPNELPSLMPPWMRPIHYSEAWRANGRHTARLWAERR